MLIPVLTLLQIFFELVLVVFLFLLSDFLPLLVNILLFHVNLYFFESLGDRNELVIVPSRRVRMIDLWEAEVLFFALLDSGKPRALQNLQILEMFVLVYVVLTFLVLLILLIIWPFWLLYKLIPHRTFRTIPIMLSTWNMFLLRASQKFRIIWVVCDWISMDQSMIIGLGGLFNW